MPRAQSWITPCGLATAIPVNASAMPTARPITAEDGFTLGTNLRAHEKFRSALERAARLNRLEPDGHALSADEGVGPVTAHPRVRVGPPGRLGAYRPVP